MKRKSVFVFVFFIFLSATSISQKKVSFQFDASILQSIGREIISTYHSEDNSFSAEYFSQKKYYRPYANLLAEVSYDFNSTVSAGVQTGIYLHFREKYFSSIEHTTVGIPLLATMNFMPFRNDSKGIGVSLAAGKLFENVDEYFFQKKDASLFRLSAFYEFDRLSAIRFGFEKQIDKVTFTYFDGGTKENKVTFLQKHNSIFLSYEFSIGK